MTAKTNGEQMDLHLPRAQPHIATFNLVDDVALQING
jgi:hypothetical protein